MSRGSAASRELLVGAYRMMYMSRLVDDKEIQFKRQNRAYFQINGVGHECIGVAVALTCSPAWTGFTPITDAPSSCK